MIKVNTMRNYLEAEGVQVSTEAASYLAFTLDARAREIAEAAWEALRRDNELRAIHGLEPRRRITADDVRRAMGAML